MNSDHNTIAALENQAFALMGRMHVTIRRQTGRVTDIEYMRIDPVYCRYLINLALEVPNDDLHQICEKLQEIYFGPEGLFVRSPPKQPLIARLSGAASKPALPAEFAALPEVVEQAAAAPPLTPEQANEAVDQTYIGRLR